MLSSLRRLRYYRNPGLLFEVIRISALVSVNVCLFRCKNLTSLCDIPLSPSENQDKAEIVKYAQFCLRLRRTFGFKDTCLTYSVLLCRILRKRGIDARINFGTHKIGQGFVGHCWVSVDGQHLQDAHYQLLFTHPDSGQETGYVYRG